MALRIGPEPAYYISPSLDVHPEGVLALGNIFTDPLYPDVPLSRQNPLLELKSTAIIETPGPHIDDRAYVEGFKVWAKVLEILQLKLGITHRENKFVGYWPEKIVTEVMEFPTQEAILKRVHGDADLKKRLKIGEYGYGTPVYMIAGRKIATNVRYSYQNDTKPQFESTLAATAQPDGIGGTVGTKGQVGREAHNRRAGTIQGDVVFAYKLLKISPKGFGKVKEQMSLNIYRKDALLGDDSKSRHAGDDDVDIQWVSVCEPLDEEADSITMANEEGTECFLIIRRDLH